MITNGNLNPALLSQVLGTSAAMSAENLAALASEVNDDPTGRGYDGKTPAEVLDLLNSPYTVANPTPQGLVTKPFLTRDEFTVFRSVVTANWSAAPDPPKEALRDLVTQVLPALAEQQGVDMTNDAVEAGLAGLLATGVLSSAEADALTKKPDPSYQATLSRTARAVVLFGGGATIELSDLVAAGV